MFDFRSKVVLITGAAQGFGRVCALAFADRGAKLALCDLIRQRRRGDRAAGAGEGCGGDLPPRQRLG